MKNRMPNYFLTLCLFILLILIRAYEEVLFYDPLKKYYENDYLQLPFPKVSLLKMLGAYFFRYLLNSIISISILKIVFPKYSMIQTIIYFYVFAFILLSVILFGLMISHLDIGYLFPFYIRRFIIHPVFVIILLPFIYLSRKTDLLNSK